MKNDLVNFTKKNNLLTLNISSNRLIVYLENQQEVEYLSAFKNLSPKLTVLSQFIPVLNFRALTDTKFVNAGEHPVDPTVYQVLGKGFKDYSYYITNLVFVKSYSDVL